MIALTKASTSQSPQVSPWELTARSFGVVAISLLTAVVLGGCSLIFMPADEAVTRCLDPIAARDGDINDLIPEQELRGQVRSVATAFGGPLYRRQKDFWRIDEIEEDEVEDRTYVYVLVDVPRKSRWTEVEIIFEMERSGRSWIIHDVVGIGALSRELDLAQMKK